MKIAVALLTCDRYDYTVQTVESFLSHNNPDDFLLFHGDDASTDRRVVEYVQSKGFQTVVQHTERKGCSPTTDALLHAVAQHVNPGALVLYLQNDIESCRPLPQRQVRDLLACPEISFVQLCYRSARTRYAKNIPWKSGGGEPWTFGDTRHEVVYGGYMRGMGFQPSISTIETWLPAVQGNKREKDFRSQSEYPDREMCRLTLPVFRHIGRLRTPDGQFGKRRAGTHSRTGRARYDQPVARRNRREVGVSVCRALCEHIKPGMKTLECGSGISTYIFHALGSNHTALEDKSQYAPPLPSVKLCPLVGDPPWYDWQPDGPYDLILVDGPWKDVGRRGILRVIDYLVHNKTVLIFDDTDRRRDRRLCREVARRFGRERVDIPPRCDLDFNKTATLIKGR